MNKLYIAPQAKLIGFVASDKIASSQGLNNSGLDKVTLNSGLTASLPGDIKLPLSESQGTI